MKKLLLIPLFLVLAGCSTSHLTPDKAIVVQPLTQATPTPERPIKVTLMRDYGAFAAAGSSFYIFDNNKKIAKLESREMTTYYAEPGNHAITAGSSSGKGNDGVSNFSEFKLGEEPELHFGVDGVVFYLKRIK